MAPGAERLRGPGTGERGPAGRVGPRGGRRRAAPNRFERRLASECIGVDQPRIVISMASGATP
jgi:hypothetical protein